MVGNSAAPRRDQTGAVRPGTPGSRARTKPLLAAGGLLVALSGCASQASAGELKAQDSLAVAPSTSAAQGVAPSRAVSPPATVPTDRGAQESDAATGNPGQMRANISVERSDAIEAALRKYLKQAPADLKSFYVVADDGSKATVGASVDYRGKIVNLSVGLATEAGQVSVKGAYQVPDTLR